MGNFAATQAEGRCSAARWRGACVVHAFNATVRDQMRLYLIRHADPDGDIDRITTAGHLEAHALAERLKKVSLTRIYCSTLRRAIETARYTADITGIEPVIEDWTTEITQCYYDAPPHGRVAVWDTPGEIIRAEQPWLTTDSWQTID